jgi:hypothetical protein
MKKLAMGSLALVVVVSWAAESEAGLLERIFRRRSVQSCPAAPPAYFPAYAPQAYAPFTPPPQAAAASVVARPGTVPAPTAAGTFRPPDGKIYTYTLEPSLHPEANEAPLQPRARRQPGSGANDTESFLGNARRDAKTSIGSGPIVTLASTGDLLDLLLAGQTPAANDSLMRSKIRSMKTPRVAEERRNVQINAFIYAAKKETDNDFHLLLGGTAPTGGDPRYLTAEVSGLPNPPNSASSTLQAARNQFKAYFLNPTSGLGLPESSHYTVFTPPIPVTVTGSVFFDIDHGRGEVGTGSIRTETVWEIHPVTGIVFH